MQIINRSYFSNQNNLYIPLAVSDPSSSPTNGGELDNLCIRLEREILLNALGLDLYNLVKNLTHDSINAGGNLRFKKLIEGEEYDGKVWVGLSDENSLIANYIFQEFVTRTQIRLSATGPTRVNAENAVNETPAYLIGQAYEVFLNQYQKRYCYAYNGLIQDSWYSSSTRVEVEQSLFSYLTDKAEDFPEWSSEKFKFYEMKNYWGL